MRSGSRIVQLNRRTHSILDETAIVKKFGVSPHSIPDYLSLVGDSADGYSGLPGWGAKSSAAVLAKFLHLERIPKDCREWRVNATNASALADTLCREWDRAVLFRRLATLRTDIAVFNDVEELRWKDRRTLLTNLPPGWMQHGSKNVRQRRDPNARRATVLGQNPKPNAADHGEFYR